MYSKYFFSFKMFPRCITFDFDVFVPHENDSVIFILIKTLGVNTLNQADGENVYTKLSTER